MMIHRKMRRCYEKNGQKSVRNSNKGEEHDEMASQHSNSDYAQEKSEEDEKNERNEERLTEIDQNGSEHESTRTSSSTIRYRQQLNTKTTSAPLMSTSISDETRTSAKESNGRTKCHANFYEPRSRFRGNHYRNGHHHTFSNRHELPPRFQRQRQREVEHLDSDQQYFEPTEVELTNEHDHMQANTTNNLQKSTNFNGNCYSPEFDNPPVLSEQISNIPILPASINSSNSSRNVDIIRSLQTSQDLIDKLISIFDTVSFSSEEFELLISKIATRHILNKQEIHRLLSLNKTDQTIERILDDTYLNQVKVLAVELQTERTRVLELTKTNAELDHTIRQLQQQQQPQAATLVHYQHMVLSYQAQMRRFVDENARLQCQINSYSMLPASINELKQQNQILSEQLRQLKIQNSALENEAAESERASKDAAELYKKADAKKQERLEQMMADINKYKKMDKELTSYRNKFQEMEKKYQEEIDEVTNERDLLQDELDQLMEKIDGYNDLQSKYEQLLSNQSGITEDELRKELYDLKLKNDQLRQENWKTNEQINHTSQEKE